MNPLLDWCARTCLMTGLLLLLAGALLLVAFLPIHPVFILVLVLALMAAARRRSRLADGTAFGTAQWCSFTQAEAAGKFQRGGLFLGRFGGSTPGNWQSLVRLFTLPAGQSAAAVRGFFSATQRR